MKVAIPTRNGKVDEHFGHCDFFSVFTINDNKEIINEELVASPNGCGCKSNIVSTLANKGVKVMLAGNMGGGAVNKLASQDIWVIRGCSGDAKIVLTEWLKGNLKDSGELCAEHEHHHEHNHQHGNNC